MSDGHRSNGRGAAPPPDLLTNLLRRVSRAFYLTLRVLPRGVREPVGVAYLLARAADTIADSRAIKASDRLRLLLAFRDLLAHSPSDEALDTLAAAISVDLSPTAGLDAGEAALLGRLDEVFDAFNALPAQDRACVRDVVVTLTTGMERDLETFPSDDSGSLAALPDADALDRYTWEVAGCVGDFWTRVTAAHTPALRGWDAARMSAVGQAFGKGLQLVNVLRDLPRDLRNGRCYLPEDELTHAGLTPSDLLRPATPPALHPVLRRWTARARAGLGAGEIYVLAIPRRCTRLRLGALWPVLIGLATLRRLERADAWLDGRQRIKVSRGWIYGMLALSVPASLSNTALRVWFRALGGSGGACTSSSVANASSRTRSDARKAL